MGCTLASSKSSHKSDRKKNKGSACVSESQDICLSSLIPKIHYPSSIYKFRANKSTKIDSREKPQSALIDLSRFRNLQSCSRETREERLNSLKTELGLQTNRFNNFKNDLDRDRESCPHILFCKYIDSNIELNLSKENVFEAKVVTPDPSAMLSKNLQENQVEISQIFRESGPIRTASLGFCRCLPNKSFELNTSDFPDYQILGDDLGV